MKKFLQILILSIGFLAGLWLSIMFMLVGGLIQLMDGLLDPFVKHRECMVLFGLFRTLIGPYFGLLIWGLSIALVDEIGKEK